MPKIGITGTRGYLSNRIKNHLSNSGEFDIELISLRGEAWKKRKMEYDVIIHVVGVTPENGKSESFYDINEKLTKDLGIKAKKDGTKKIIFISTMAVYGIKASVKSGEGVVHSNTKCNPDDDYGKSKFLGENELMKLKSKSFHVAIVRVPSIYGEENIKYLQMYKSMAENMKVFPVMHTKCYRSSIYVGNLCECIYKIISKDVSGIICPEDKDKLSTYEYVRIVSKASNIKVRYSRVLGMLLRVLPLKRRQINEMFGSVEYHRELSNIEGVNYWKFDSKKAIEESVRHGKQILEV